MKIPFSKYQGTGNDFVLIDNRASVFPEADVALVKKLCDRRFGIGDGLILLEEKGAGLLRMVYYNSDGNLSSMCGNGGRCFAAFARQCGIVNDEIVFEAADGLHRAIFTIAEPLTVKMSMGDVRKVEASKINGTDILYLDTGSPHVVMFVKDVMKVVVADEGRAIRNSEPFREKGTNVNFVQRDSSRLIVRTYERGVEDETYSCGTGVTASALAAATSDAPNQVCEVQVLGGKLKVHFTKAGNAFTDVWLEGEATYVYQGDVDTIRMKASN